MIRIFGRAFRSRFPVPVLIVIITVMWPGDPARTAPAPAGTRFSRPLNITNPYHPFVPGGIKILMGEEDGDEILIIDVYATETRTFHTGGRTVRCHILQETEYVNGELLEISQNYFAQSDDGGVYYFGETVNIYEDGEVVAHDGSWLVGGPQPGDPTDTATAVVPALFMPANPQVGDTFKPEDLFPFVDETVEVLKTNLTKTVPAGQFTGVIKVRESTQLNDETEDKWYAPGVGVIRGPDSALVMTTFVHGPGK